MTDTPTIPQKSYAELVATYSESQYKMWLDMAAREANTQDNSLQSASTDFTHSDEGRPVTEYSANQQKFL